MKILDFLLRKKQMQRLPKSTAGFTLVEVMVVVVMVSILAAISVYSLQSWVNRVRVNGVQDKVLSAIQEAQNRARQQATSWQVSCRQVQQTPGERVIYVAIHPVEKSNSGANPPFASSDPDYWKIIDEPGVEIDTNTTFTTAEDQSSFAVGNTTGPVWRIQFDSKGNLIIRPNEHPRPRITLSFKGTMPKRCVQVVTPLGATRSEGDGTCDD